MGDNLPPVDLGNERFATELAQSSDQHNCATLDNSQLKCWGRNQYGQLGYGDTDSRGDENGEMGDNLPAVDLGTWEVPATCDSFSCDGDTPVNKGSDEMCLGNAATCDTDTCCEARATCDSFSCDGDTPINKGSDEMCLGNAATCDTDTCCEARSTCD